MPRVSPEQHAKRFDRWYETGAGRAATPHHRIVCQSYPDFRPGIDSILDVGCGPGRMIEEFEARGFRVEGTEICQSLLASELKRMDVYPYSVDELVKLEDLSYGLVLMVDLLDHLRDEREVDAALGHARRLSTVGTMITLGGVPSQRTIDQPPDWWAGKIGCSFDAAPIMRTERGSGVQRWLYWWEGSEF